MAGVTEDLNLGLYLNWNKSHGWLVTPAPHSASAFPATFPEEARKPRVSPGLALSKHEAGGGLGAPQPGGDEAEALGSRAQPPVRADLPHPTPLQTWPEALRRGRSAAAGRSPPGSRPSRDGSHPSSAPESGTGVPGNTHPRTHP